MGILESLDAGLINLFGQWNSYSTGLATLLVAIITYSIMSRREPDMHPFLLARQSVPSTVRHEARSAIYRPLTAPHSVPLVSGLNVKAPGASKWSAGRDGDLRDVWRGAASGDQDGAKGRIYTLNTRDGGVCEHRLEEITRQINIIGQHLTVKKSSNVGICLPNSVELLIALFACSFHTKLTAVLITHDAQHDELISALKRANVDVLITTEGRYSDEVATQVSLRQLISVVDKSRSSRSGRGAVKGPYGSIETTLWENIINGVQADDVRDVPSWDPEAQPQDIVTFWRTSTGKMPDMVRFTQTNLVAGIAGQLAGLPARELLYSNASLILSEAVRGQRGLALNTASLTPTIISASPETLLQVHKDSTRKLRSVLAKVSYALSTRSLTRDGVHSSSALLSSFLADAKPTIGAAPGKLRLVYTADKVQADCAKLSSQVLSDLRVFLGARIIYALSAPKVAGAVSQTAAFDYRVKSGGQGHFGAPLPCVEVYLRDKDGYKTTDDSIEGEVCDILPRGDFAREEEYAC